MHLETDVLISKKYKSTVGNTKSWAFLPLTFAGTDPQILLQADVFLSNFSTPPYYFNLLFFPPTAAVSFMSMFLSLKAYT